MGAAKKIKIPRVASYEQAKAEAHAHARKTNPKVECRDCDGHGETEERCCCCDGYSETECRTCGGRGWVRYSDLSSISTTWFFSESDYLRAVVRDVTDLAGWLGVAPEMVARESGFAPYTFIADRSLNVTRAGSIQDV